MSSQQNDIETAPQQGKTNVSTEPATSLSHLTQEHKTNGAPSIREWSRWQDLLIFTCWMLIGSYAGVIARYYLMDLAAYSGFSTYEAYWPNIVGCVLMGIITHHKKFLIERHGLTNFHLGLGTALCGCLTTFSSWNEEAALVLVSFDSNPKYSTADANQAFTWMNIIITGFTTSYMSLLAGFHIASLSPWGNAPSDRIENLVSKRYGALSSFGKWFKNNELAVAIVCCVIATGLVVGVPVGYGEYQITFEAVLGFFGAVLRYKLGKELNRPHFPYGTFAANIFAVLVLCGFYIWQVEENNFPSKPVLNDFITGITSGFCGSLSTVSTFMNENYGLKRSGAWRYSSVSIISAQVLAGLILGGYTWAQ